MNLVGALGSGERDLIWRYLMHYDPAIEGDADTMKMTRELMECALNFYRDFIEPAKLDYAPSDGEREQLRALSAWLAQNGEAGAEEIRKGDLRTRPPILRQAGQDFPAALPRDHGPGARPAPGRLHSSHNSRTGSGNRHARLG